MLTFTTLAVTVAEADAYCTARGIAAWTGTNADKTAALRRGQDYIAGKYNGRWTYETTDNGVTTYLEWQDTTAPSAVKYAVIEAAAREIAVPFSLTPDVVVGSQKVLTEVKGIKWQAMGNGTAASFRPVIEAINLLLRGYVTSGSAIMRA